MHPGGRNPDPDPEVIKLQYSLRRLQHNPCTNLSRIVEKKTAVWKKIRNERVETLDKKQNKK
jgi:hypothetical protein